MDPEFRFDRFVANWLGPCLVVAAAMALGLALFASENRWWVDAGGAGGRRPGRDGRLGDEAPGKPVSHLRAVSASRAPTAAARLPLGVAVRMMRTVTTLRFEAASGEWVFDPVLPSPWQAWWRSTESFGHEPTRHARRLRRLRMGIVDLR